MVLIIDQIKRKNKEHFLFKNIYFHLSRISNHKFMYMKYKSHEYKSQVKEYNLNIELRLTLSRREIVETVYAIIVRCSTIGTNETSLQEAPEFLRNLEEMYYIESDDI